MYTGECGLFSKRREIQIYRYSEHSITYTAQKPETRHRSGEKGEKKIGVRR